MVWYPTFTMDISEGRYQEMQGLADEAGREDPQRERIIQIVCGPYRSAQGVYSHVLYALADTGVVYKMTRDGWTKVQGLPIGERGSGQGGDEDF